MTDTTTETEARPPWTPIIAVYDVRSSAVQLGAGSARAWIDLGGAANVFPPPTGSLESDLAELAELGRRITHLAEARLAEIGGAACTMTLDLDGSYRHHEPCPTHPDAAIVPEPAKAVA